MEMLNLKNAMIGAILFASMGATAQNDPRDLQNYRTPGFDGLNVFEAKKSDVPFDGIKVRVGGDFALQFQSINHENAWNSDTTLGVPQLTNLGSNVNLPTANLNLDVQLADGLRLHLRTYLSSRHHNEAWVKGGYMRIDNLNFIKDGLLSGLMDMTFIKFGYDDLNYGDTHFRRSDNATAIYNPFVGNYIMDAFTTEPFAEITVTPSDFLFVLGMSNGNLNQTVNVAEDADMGVSLYGKVGWDSQISDDLRVRLTGSFFNTSSYDNGKYLYSGDRAGARYYWVMVEDGAADDFRSGRFNPGFTKYTSLQFNPFVKFKGLEFFGVFEVTNGDKKDDDTKNADDKLVNQKGGYTQIGAELLYRFGSWEQFYVGGRYNSVSGQGSEAAMTTNISRINAGLGWFMTKNVLAKLEYVTQSYGGDGYEGTKFQDGNFNGIMFEAVIGF